MMKFVQMLWERVLLALFSKSSRSITLCLLGNFILLFFWCLMIFSKSTFSTKFFQEYIPSECQTVWILIRLEILSGLIRAKTVCKSYQQTKLVNYNELNLCEFNQRNSVAIQLKYHL